jgi:DNA-binding beta-propeller fold protein YncE
MVKVGRDLPSAVAPQRRRKVLVRVGPLLIAVLTVLAGVRLAHRGPIPVAATKGRPSPRTPNGVLPSNSLAEIDPASGRVLASVAIRGLGSSANHLFAHAVGPFQNPVLAVGEEGVWVLTGPHLLHVDERTLTVRGVVNPAFGPPVASSLAVGHGAVWFPVAGGLDVVDAASDRLVAVLRFRSLGSPSAVAVGGRSVWVGFSDGTLVRLDPVTRKAVRAIRVGGSIDAIGAAEGAVWTLDRLHNLVYHVDQRSGTVVGRVGVRGEPMDIEVGSGAVWILDSAGTVVPIDAGTDSAQGAIPVGGTPSDIAAGLGAIWVTDQTDGIISRIDLTTRAVTTLSVGSPLAAIAIDEIPGRLWVAVAGGRP